MKHSFEVLIATMNQKNDALLKNMHIDSDAIVCNQNTETSGYTKYIYNGNNIRWYDFQERGVGLNRNNALMRATADVCLIADDDVVYKDNYKNIVLDTFEKNPDADMILFNIESEMDKNRFICKKKMRVNRLNCGKFGGVRIAFRRQAIIKNAITFNLLFGGGALFSAGEDNMFIRDAIRKGVKVIAVPECILSLSSERDSTWFSGYDEKFLRDLGVSYVVHFGKSAYVMAMIQLIRHRKEWLTNYSFSEAKKFVKNGIKIYKDL